MLTLLLALALNAQTAAAPAAPAVSKDDAAIFAAQDARLAAMVAGKADDLETALHASLTYHHSSGAGQSKAEFIKAIRDGVLKYKGLDVAERRVRRFGSIALITGIIHLQALNNGEVVNSQARFTDVYENDHGHWLEVAWQSTRIPQPTP